MLASAASPGSIVLAVAVVLATIVAAFAVVSAHRRRMRGDDRRTARGLERRFADLLEGRLEAGALRAAVAASEPGPFWTALERFALGLESREWMRLSAALADHAHAAEERDALREDSPWRRELAARRLGLAFSPSARRALRRALVRGPEPVRHAAALSLGRFRDLAALRWLLAHPGALARRLPRARIAVLSSFGPEAVPELRAALERDLGEPRMERAVVEMLGLAGDREAAARIERRLGADDVEVRIAAARALGRLRADAAAAGLIAALRDEAWAVRAQAARALGRMRSPLGLHALAAALTDRSWWVRRHAAYALGELGEDGRAALRHAASASDDPYARDMAREVLDGGFPKSA